MWFEITQLNTVNVAETTWEVLKLVIVKRRLRSQVQLRLNTASAGRPRCTDDLSMGLTIGSKYKQEISSVYQFIDVLYNLRS